MSRWPRILFYGARLAYLRAVHRRIVAIDPTHDEASRTWREIQTVRERFDAAWSAS